MAGPERQMFVCTRNRPPPHAAGRMRDLTESAIRGPSRGNACAFHM